MHMGAQALMACCAATVAHGAYNHDLHVVYLGVGRLCDVSNGCTEGASCHVDDRTVRCW